MLTLTERRAAIVKTCSRQVRIQKKISANKPIQKWFHKTSLNKTIGRGNVFREW